MQNWLLTVHQDKYAHSLADRKRKDRLLPHRRTQDFRLVTQQNKTEILLTGLLPHFKKYPSLTHGHRQGKWPMSKQCNCVNCIWFHFSPPSLPGACTEPSQFSPVLICYIHAIIFLQISWAESNTTCLLSTGFHIGGLTSLH